MKHWQEYTPEQAAELFPNGMIGQNIILPKNENGEECPFPYDPQQLKNAPVGQYHCPYCAAMVLAGIPHLDYSETQKGLQLGGIPQNL